MRHDVRFPQVLSTEQIVSVFRLLRGVETVELKVGIADADRRSVATALEMIPLDAQIREVTFFDTSDLALDRQGVVLRVRRVHGGVGDSAVKLWPVVPHEIPAAVRRSADFRVELDVMPGGYSWAGAMTTLHDEAVIEDVTAGRQPLHTAFSEAQRALFTQHAPAGVELDDLAALGPITTVGLELRPEVFGRRVVAESWHHPDGSRVVELSTTCDPIEAFQVAAEARILLAGRGIDLAVPQQAKARTALEHVATPRRAGLF